MANITNGLGQTKVGVRPQSAPATSYLLDTYSGASAAYSLRKLRTAYSGYAIRVRRSLDSTSQDIGFDANGILDTTTLLSFVGSGTGFVSVWYDQSGNGKNATQTSASNQPLIVVGGVIYTLNGKPIVRNPDTRTIRCMNVPVPTLQSRPVSIIATGKIYQYPASAYGNTAWYLGGDVNVGGGSRYEFLSSPGGGFAINRRGNSSSILVNNGTNVTSPFIQQGHFASGTITNRLNGVDVTSAVSDTDQFTTNSNFVIIGANPNSVEFMPSIGMYEYIFYFTDKTSDRTSIESNINSFYSIY